MPGNDLPKATWLDQIHADKLVHMGMYAVMVFLFLRAQSKSKQQFYKSFYKALPFILFGMGYGIAMELVQLFFTDSRKFEVADMIANSAGAIAGFYVFRKWFVKRFQT